MCVCVCECECECVSVSVCVWLPMYLIHDATVTTYNFVHIQCTYKL